MRIGWILVVPLLSLFAASWACGSSLEEDISAVETLRGRIMHRSDVETIPDEPYRLGHVLVLREEAWPALLREVADDRGPSHDLRGVLLDEPSFSRWVEFHDSLRTDGTFGFEIVPGSYRVCVGNLGEEGSAPPVFVYGCTPVDLISGETLFVDASYGESGIDFIVK